MNQKISHPKPSQYHFCVRITPKTLSMNIFESKGIQSLYKLQIDKGSKKQTYEVMRRNLHEEALQGFYKSQKCYFTLNNYTNLRPYEMKVIFSEISNSTGQQEEIFIYKFSTFGIVKNFLQNGVRRSTHVVTVDYQTQFYIDLYIQSNKSRLEEKVKLDGNMQTLRKRYVQDSEQETQNMMEKIGMNDSFYEKYSDVNRNSLHSNYSPSRSSHRNSQSLHRMNSQNLSFTGARLSMPINGKNDNQNRSKRRNLISNQRMQDSRSQKISHSKSKNYVSSHKNLHGNLKVNEKMFLKKSPSTQLSVGEFGQSNKNEKNSQRQRNTSFHVSNKPSFQLSQQLSIRTNQLSETTSTNKDSFLSEKDENQTYLQLIYNVKNMSADEITYKFKKNLVFLLFVLLIVFIVFSKAFDVAGLEEHKNIDQKSKKLKSKNKKFNKVNESLNDKSKNQEKTKINKQQHSKIPKTQKQKQGKKKSKNFKGTFKSF